MTKKSKTIRIAVRDFAVPLVRKGSLGYEQASGLSLDLGTEIHQQIQQRLAGEFSDYQAEYPVNFLWHGQGISLHISGRCDGRFPAEPSPPLFHDEPARLVFEEIKSSYNLRSLKKQLRANPQHPYWLQLGTYLYMVRERSEEEVFGRLRLVCSKTRVEELVDYHEEQARDFESWFTQRCEQIVAEYDYYEDLKAKRKILAEQLSFPYQEVRPAQQDLIQGVDNQLKEFRQLLVQAPTGIGKTAGILFPALKRALGRGAPIFYITPKNSQFQAAIDFAAICQDQGQHFKVLVLTARAKICLNDEISCQADRCDFAKDYYDKLPSELARRDEATPSWDKNYFVDKGRLYQLCPYELSMARVREADLIICDYNYVASLRGSLIHRYQHPYLKLPKPVLVVDEAHNLYMRAIENFSPAIHASLLKTIVETESQSLAPREGVKAIAEQGLGILTSGNWGDEGGDDGLSELGERLRQVLIDLMLAGESLALSDPALDLYLSLLDIIDLSRLGLNSFRRLRQQASDGSVISLRLLCLDPGPILSSLLTDFDRIIAFSATLKPFDFYRNMIGFAEDQCQFAEFISPFPREHKKIVLIPQVATSYRERDQHYARIAEVIKRSIPLALGHYLAFFPGYGFLAAVRQHLENELGSFQLIEQKAAMSPSEIDQILSQIHLDSQPSLILAVQGGSLAEGIDLKGRGLKGVFVVGPGLPGFSPEKKLMEEYFESRYGKGHDYTYTFPGMAKSVQAAGRVVRSPTERGLIVLMDRRFLQEKYYQAMPSDWFQSHPKELVSSQILQDIAEFWSCDRVRSNQVQGMAANGQGSRTEPPGPVLHE